MTFHVFLITLDKWTSAIRYSLTPKFDRVPQAFLKIDMRHYAILELKITNIVTGIMIISQNRHSKFGTPPPPNQSPCIDIVFPKLYCKLTKRATLFLSFSLGNDLLHIIDLKNPRSPRIVYYTTLPGGELTDVETCGDYVAVAWDNKVNPLDGKVFVYKGFDNMAYKMDKIHSLSG